MMTVGQRVEVEHRGRLNEGRITKVVNKHSCVVSWREGKVFRFNVLFRKEQVEKGRVTYESAIAK